MNTTSDIANRFAEFYMLYMSNPVKTDLDSDTTIALLLEVVRSAGFNADHIEFGRLYEPGAHEDSRINTHCPFRVIDSKKKYPTEMLRALRGDESIWMTGWLDCVFSVLADLTRKNTVNVDTVTDRIQYEIIRSQELKPILITIDGDCLAEVPPDRNSPPDKYLPGLFDHTTDNIAIQDKLGIHENFGCQGTIFIRYSNNVSTIATCKECSLRITFPKETQTYGELRSYFAKCLAPQDN